MGSKRFLILAAVTLLPICTFQRLHCTETAVKKDADSDEIDELELLEDVDEKTSSKIPDKVEEEYGGEEFDNFDGEDESSSAMPEVDKKDVAMLKEGNFSDFIAKNRFVMVQFYAPWYGYCQALTPEYAAAATDLKGEVALAKVNATEGNDLAEKYSVQRFPTIYFFVDGVHRPYPSERTKGGIVSWIKRKTGPAVFNLTSTQDAEALVEPKSTVQGKDYLCPC